MRRHHVDGKFALDLVDGVRRRPVRATGMNRVRLGMARLDLAREFQRQLAGHFSQSLDGIAAGDGARGFDAEFGRRVVVVVVEFGDERMHGRDLARAERLQRLRLRLRGGDDLDAGLA